MFYTEEFINHLKMNHYSYSTLKAYRKDLGHFEAHLVCNGIEEALNISGTLKKKASFFFPL